MITSVRQRLDVLLAKPIDGLQFTANGFERIEQPWREACSQLVNVHTRYSAQIHYLRVASGDNPQKITLSSMGAVEGAWESGEFGLVLRVCCAGVYYAVWLPPASGRFYFDEHQRIKTSYGPPLSYYQSMLLARLQGRENMATSGLLPTVQWEFYPRLQLSVLPPTQVGEVIVIPYVVLEDPDGQLLDELSALNDVERRLYRKSSWFFASRPVDIWNYLINGSIYDPRSEKGIDRRFKCQQCAYSWWSYFDFLHKETGKKVYALMQDEIANSVLLDMSSSGEWGHGFWSNDVETHARFHLDGLHLLISQYEKTGESLWLEAAERGMTFVIEYLMEQLGDGNLWFLHDTMERHKRHRFKSTLLGKTPGNSLCLNTHVQALTVLHRLKVAVPDKELYAEMFEKGTRALRNVLDHQPGEAWYRMLMSWIMRYKTREALSIWSKLITHLEERLIQMIYWSVRRRFPRLVHPGGFTARDLTLSFASDWYHITNLKDFLTLYRQEPLTWLRSYIEDGYKFVSEFLDKTDLMKAIAGHPHYIEFIDVLYLYDKLIEPVPFQEMEAVEQKIYQQTKGYSLDYYASELCGLGRSKP